MKKLYSIIIIIVVVALSLAGNIFLGVKLFEAHQEIERIKGKIQLNASVLHFANLFIFKVLKAESEVSFEDRLQIENAVRDTKDPDIIDTWRKLVSAKTQAEAREEIKNLLQLIIDKLSNK